MWMPPRSTIQRQETSDFKCGPRDSDDQGYHFIWEFTLSSNSIKLNFYIDM